MSMGIKRFVEEPAVLARCLNSKQQLHLNSVEGSTHENSDNISVAHDTLHRRVAGLPMESQPRAADDNFPEISRNEDFENIFLLLTLKLVAQVPTPLGKGSACAPIRGHPMVAVATCLQ